MKRDFWTLLGQLGKILWLVCTITVYYTINSRVNEFVVPQDDVFYKATLPRLCWSCLNMIQFNINYYISLLDFAMDNEST